LAAPDRITYPIAVADGSNNRLDLRGTGNSAAERR
jgi:hypothetical protein